MYLKEWILILVIFGSILPDGEGKKGRNLLRKKRYIAFPEGAAFSAVWCLTSQLGITDGATIFTEGINWGLVYDLPNDTKPFLDLNKSAQKRRNRRDLYVKVEDILTSIGYNGKACILRSLCEANRNFKSKEDSLLHHILKLVFRFPDDPVLPHEPDDHRMYHWATKIGQRSIADNEYDNSITEDCSEIFRCPFSLIDMALGHYNGFDSMSHVME